VSLCMKVAVLIAYLFLPCFGSNSQGTLLSADSFPTVSSHSIRLIAHVKDLDEDYVLLEVEEVISFSSGIYLTPALGDELLVHLPGREMPKKESRIEVDLQEMVDVGAMPTGYILTNFKTIE